MKTRVLELVQFMCYMYSVVCLYLVDRYHKWIGTEPVMVLKSSQRMHPRMLPKARVYRAFARSRGLFGAHFETVGLKKYAVNVVGGYIS